jgi:hypothetical protein
VKEISSDPQGAVEFHKMQPVTETQSKIVSAALALEGVVDLYFPPGTDAKVFLATADDDGRGLIALHVGRAIFGFDAETAKRVVAALKEVL